jgi:hypothetical protein
MRVSDNERAGATPEAPFGGRDWAWEEAREVGRAMSFEEAVSFVFDGGDPPA